MSISTNTIDTMAAIDAMAARLRDDYGADAVILYGSRAKGTARPNSDIDLLVIKDAAGNRFERIREVSDSLEDLTNGYSLDALVLSQAQIEGLLKEGNHFMQDVLMQGKSLVDCEIHTRLLRLAEESYDMNPEESQFPEYWLRYAEQDFTRMRALLDMYDPEGAAFQLQQAAEKFFKAYLIRQGWRLRRTHDLVDMLEEAVKFDASLAQYRAVCKTVGHYYLAARYPAEPGDPNPSPMGENDIRASIAAITPLIERLRTGSAKPNI